MFLCTIRRRLKTEKDGSSGTVVSAFGPRLRGVGGFTIPKVDKTVKTEVERTGAVVKPRTLGREVPGLSPPVAVRCGLEQVTYPLVLCRLSPAIENLSPWLKIGDNRLNYRLSELRYGSKCFHNIWLICSWLGSSKRSNSILHLFSTYFKFNSYKIEAKKALNLAKLHDFSRDGRSHIVVVSLRF